MLSNSSVNQSKDPYTGRVYEERHVISETPLATLKTLKHKQDPTQKMLTVVEFLSWVAKEAPPKMKVMLDIKTSNDPTVLMKVIRCMLDANDDLEYWKPKVIFGLWSLEFYQFGVSTGLLSGFEIINITISPTIARGFLEYSKSLPPQYKLKAVSLMLIATTTPEFKTLRAELMEPEGVLLYLWTLNSQDDFDQGYLLDCKNFITDNVVEATAAVKEFKSGKEPRYVPPPLLSAQGVKGTLRYSLYRLFEWTVLSGWNRYRPVQTGLFFILRLIAKGQK